MHSPIVSQSLPPSPPFRFFVQSIRRLLFLLPLLSEDRPIFPLPLPPANTIYFRSSIIIIVIIASQFFCAFVAPAILFSESIFDP